MYIKKNLKWDLIIDNTPNGLTISNLHLSPISNNIPYTHQSEENLLNRSHEDNVKSYYKNMESYFYSDGMSPEFKHNWPVIVRPGAHAYTYNDMCDMGCRRMKHYDVYNKQFEFFCPLWLEHITDDIHFKFNVIEPKNGNVISQRVLTIKKNDLNNRFSQYFYNYADNCGLIDGSDNVMKIDLTNSTAYMTGLDVKVGLHTLKDISNVINIITSRERPLMEFDNILISNFSNNCVIVNQLFNFNFCFNLTDIVSGTISNVIGGNAVTVSIDVYMGDTILERKDFNTEYDYIPKQVIYTDGSMDEDINLFNYLIDHKCVDLATMNKYFQPICHWSLCECNDYIFNLYNGFSGFSIINGEIIQSNHQYGKTPSFDTIGHSEYINNTGWINIFTIGEWSDFYLFVTDTNENKPKMCKFGDSMFVNDVKYSRIPSIPIYFCGVVVNPKLYGKIVNNYEYTHIHGRLIAISMYDVIIFVSDDINDFSHRYLYENLNKIGGCYVLDNFAKIMSSYVEPAVISIKSSLVATRANSPSHMTNEMTYYKDNNSSEYVLRYDGKIKPNFTTSRTMYYKDYISDGNIASKLKSSPYGQYANSGYEPLYKSIGYYSILSRDIDYIKIPDVMVSEFSGNVPLNTNVEYKWFNNGLILSIRPELHFTIIKTSEDNLEDKIIEELTHYYGNDNINYIRNLYDVSYDWDYVSSSNVTDYRFNITLKLK